MTSTRILIAEDDEYLRSALVLALRHKGYAVESVSTGPQVLTSLKTSRFDLLLLDLGLPELDGTDVLKKVRREGEELAVIIITARDSVQERIEGLDLGANDYLVKPFDFGELEARIRASLRKTTWNNRLRVCLGPLTLNTDSGEIELDGTEVTLTKRETVVLRALMASQNRVVSKQVLADQLSDWSDESSENAVEIVVHRIRKKLSGTGVQISTVRGFGYTLEMVP